MNSKTVFSANCPLTNTKKIRSDNCIPLKPILQTPSTHLLGNSKKELILNPDPSNPRYLFQTLIIGQALTCDPVEIQLLFNGSIVKKVRLQIVPVDENTFCFSQVFRCVQKITVPTIIKMRIVISSDNPNAYINIRSLEYTITNVNRKFNLMCLDKSQKGEQCNILCTCNNHTKCDKEFNLNPHPIDNTQPCCRK
jgi:hypothetical protein